MLDALKWPVQDPRVVVKLTGRLVELPGSGKATLLLTVAGLGWDVGRSQNDPCTRCFFGCVHSLRLVVYPLRLC